MEFASLNKREPFGEGLELQHETKESQSVTKETGAQNNRKPLKKTRNYCVDQKNINRKTKEIGAQNNTKPLEKAWNYCVDQKEVSPKTKNTTSNTKRIRLVVGAGSKRTEETSVL